MIPTDGKPKQMENEAHEPAELEELGILAGTDKSSVLQDYLRHYERIFSPFRESKINVLEIGIAGGASLAMWTRYFRNARLIGIDVDASCFRFENDRVIVRIGSQADERFLREVCHEFPPTIIIDDGSHLADHNKLTFGIAFPMLKPGGIYVIEDLYLHFGDGASRWRGNSDKPPQAFICDLASKIMAAPIEAGGESALKPLADQIDYVTIIRRAAAFHKKSEDSERRWEKIWPVLETARIGSNWFHLAATIAAEGGPADRAIAAARNAVDLAPEDVPARARLVALLQQSGQARRASEEAALALKLLGHTPNIGEFRPMLDEAVGNAAS
jgi:hypothetical protein